MYQASINALHEIDKLVMYWSCIVREVLFHTLKPCPHYKQVCTSLQQQPVPKLFLFPHWHSAEPAPHHMRGLNN